MKALLLLAAVLVISLAGPIESQTPAAPSLTPVQQSATYVGSTACRQCHQANYDRWTKTRMANVVTDPHVRPEVIIPDLSKPDPVRNLMSLYPDSGRVISASGGVITTTRPQLEEAIKAHGKGGTDWMKLFLAMAYMRLGQVTEARRWLGTVLKWEQANQNAAWWARVLTEVLRREAEALIKQEGDAVSLKEKANN